MPEEHRAAAASAPPRVRGTVRPSGWGCWTFPMPRTVGGSGVARIPAECFRALWERRHVMFERVVNKAQIPHSTSDIPTGQDSTRACYVTDYDGDTTQSEYPPMVRSGRTRMKIVFFHHNVFGIGGTIRTIFTQAEALAARHDVEIVSVLRSRERPLLPLSPTVRLRSFVDIRDPRPDEFGEQGRRIYENDQRSGRPSAYFPDLDGRSHFFSELVDDRMAEFLRSTDAHVLIGARAGLNIMLLAMAPSNLALVAQAHVPFTSYSRPYRELITGEYPRLHGIVTVTEADAQSYRDNLDECSVPVVAIPNPCPAPTLLADRPDTKTIVTAGRLVAMKRFDLLIDAFALVHPEFPDWQLRIYGGGEEMDNLRRHIRARGLCDNVILPGSHRSLDEAWALASMSAMSSRYESFGLTIVEAMRSGLPVVSTDCPVGPKEIVRDGEDGLLVTNGSAEAMAEGLRTLMGDDERRRSMSEAAVRNAARFDPAVIATRHEELFTELTGMSVPNAPLPAISGPGDERPACGAVAHPSGDVELSFVKPPEEVVLRGPDQDGERLEERLTPTGEGRVLVTRDMTPVTGRWTVRRVDGDTESGIPDVSIDARDHLPDRTAAGIGFVLPVRGPNNELALSVRCFAQWAEVRKVDVGVEKVTIEATVHGFSEADPRARVIAMMRRDRSVVREFDCPIAADGSLRAVLPLRSVASPRRESEDFWELRLSLTSGETVRMGKSLVGIGEHKRVIRYPARVVSTSRRHAARVWPYYTADLSTLAIRTDAAPLDPDPFAARVLRFRAMVPGPIRRIVARLLPSSLRRRLRIAHTRDLTD